MAITDRPADQRTAGASESIEEQWRRAEAELRILGSSIAAVTEEVRELGRMEMALARTELQENVALARAGVMFGATAGVLALLVLGFVGLSVMYALAEVIPLWASALIVAGVLGIITAVVGLMARQRFSEFSLIPRHTVRSLQEDMQWASGQLRRNGR